MPQNVLLSEPGSGLRGPMRRLFETLCDTIPDGEQAKLSAQVRAHVAALQAAFSYNEFLGLNGISCG
jgi:hypothetical protein